jgi:hypothetical protein
VVLKQLEAISCDDLKVWLAQLVKPENNPDLTAASTITKVYNESEKPEFKLNIKKIVTELLTDWRLDIDPDMILYELVSLSGHIRISEAYRNMLSLVKSDHLKGRFVKKKDLHLHLLEVMGTLTFSGDFKFIVNRDFDTPLYTTTLFNAIWIQSDEGFSQAIELLDRFIKAYPDPLHENDFLLPLKTFLTKFGLNNFKRSFGRIIESLSDDNFALFLDCLEKCGYNLSSADNDYSLYFDVEKSRLPPDPKGMKKTYIPSKYLENIGASKKGVFFNVVEAYVKRKNDQFCLAILNYNSEQMADYLTPN